MWDQLLLLAIAAAANQPLEAAGLHVLLSGPFCGSVMTFWSTGGPSASCVEETTVQKFCLRALMPDCASILLCSSHAVSLIPLHVGGCVRMVCWGLPPAVNCMPAVWSDPNLTWRAVQILHPQFHCLAYALFSIVLYVTPKT